MKDSSRKEFDETSAAGVERVISSLEDHAAGGLQCLKDLKAEMIRVRQQRPAKAVMHKPVNDLLKTFTENFLKVFHKCNVPVYMHIETKTGCFFAKIMIVSRQ